MGRLVNLAQGLLLSVGVRLAPEPRCEPAAGEVESDIRWSIRKVDWYLGIVKLTEQEENVQSK